MLHYSNVVHAAKQDILFALCLYCRTRTWKDDNPFAVSVVIHTSCLANSMKYVLMLRLAPNNKALLVSCTGPQAELQGKKGKSGSS